MASPTRAATLALYRDMLRAASKFTNYNFRDYAVRNVRDRFREGSRIVEPTAAHDAYLDGRQQLDLIQRQATVSQLFPQGKHAMESGMSGPEALAAGAELKYGGHLKDRS